jgi:aryl-alcohol dehydrogenase
MGETPVQAAVAYDRNAALKVEALALREPQAGELRIRIVATSVCHTDIMTKDQGLCAFPIVLGHEGAGVVDAIGAGVSDFQIGDHVVLSYDYCGQCGNCRNDKPAYCERHGELNFAGVRPDGAKTHRSAGSDTADVYGSFFQQSSFASYALSHSSNTIKVDRSLPLATLAPLGCGVQTGAGTVLNTLKVQSGSSLAIFGCGCVGLSAVMAAKAVNAKNIIAVDINPGRLRAAARFGATHTILPADHPEPAALVEHVKSLTGGCHYAIDTSGVPAVLRQAFDVCGPLGITAMIAPNVPGTEVSIEMLGLLPGKSLRGVIQGDSVSKVFIPQLIAMWQAGDFPFDELITEFHGIDAINTAFAAMQRGEVIKPVVILDDVP